MAQEHFQKESSAKGEVSERTAANKPGILKRMALARLGEHEGKSFDETKKKLLQIQFEKLPINKFEGLRDSKTI